MKEESRDCLPTEAKFFPYGAKFKIEGNHRSDYLEIFITSTNGEKELFSLRMKRTDLILAIGGDATTCNVQIK